MPNGNPGTFLRAEYQDLTLERIYQDFEGKVSLNECMKLLIQMQREIIWRSEHYQVALDYEPKHGFKGMKLLHISVKRLDKEPIHDWRDLQAIKNRFAGDEAEALELYPAESRKVDSANQFHLWAFLRDEKRKRHPKVPVGWTDRYVHDDPFINGKQRPLLDTEEKSDVIRGA